MYLHVGNNKNIRIKDIIGIFDMDNATLNSTLTKKYLSAAQKRGEVESAGDDIPKSFILYRVGLDTKVCFSTLSAASLLGSYYYELVGDGALDVPRQHEIIS